MKKRSGQLRKEKQEEDCARCFLEWYNKHCGTSYRLKRAEEVFPELTSANRWEFVARQEGGVDWVAIEVKGLVIPQSRRQFMDWSKFFERVTKDVDRMIKGDFLVCGAPALALNQKEQLQLRRAVVQAILDAALGMGTNEKLDLGSKILNRFKDWPFTPHLEMEPQQHIVKNAHELWLFKTADSGCSVELGMSPPHIFSVQEEEEEAVRRLFEAKNGGAKANEQL